MENTLIYLREISAIALSLLLLHYFSAHYYQLSLWEVTKWWATNATSVKTYPLYLFGILFALIFIILSTSGVINTVYLGLLGEKQELIYLGNSKKNFSTYYNARNNKQSTLSNYDHDNAYNFSFDNLYRSQKFVKDIGSTKAVGTKANRFTFHAIIAVFVGFTLFTQITLVIYNTLVHTTYIANPTNISLPRDDSLKAIDVFLGTINQTRSNFFILMAILGVIWLTLALTMPKNKLSNPISSMPAHIKAGDTIEGIPVEIEIRYIEKRKSSGSNSYEKVDTGERYVNFMFTKGFSHTVYVATLFDTEKLPRYEENITSNINAQSPMTLYIKDDLSIMFNENEK